MKRKRQTLLDKAIGNREVIAEVNGQISYDKRSNLYKSIIAHGYTLKDIYSGQIEIAIGARRQYKTMGYKMAIVKSHK